ncbi:unnamed protein product [Trichobilharzia szidati]|nr:unnamed protein product [Trichobilharzia szidati]
MKCNRTHNVCSIYNTVILINFCFVKLFYANHISPGINNIDDKHSGGNDDDDDNDNFQKSILQTLKPEQLKVVKAGEKDAISRLYGESVFELHNDILHLKSSSLRNFNIKMYESKPEEEIQYTEEIPRYIIQPPPILYTSKWQPAIVQCVAESVVLLYIVCVTNPSNSNARYDYSMETTGLPPVYHSTQKFKQHRKSDVDDDVKFVENSSNNKHNRKVVIRLIDENTVEEWFGDYWCHCEAWNNILELGEPRVKISNQTHVRIAYLNKRFVKHPESTRIPLGWTVEFTCEPPDGRPIPKVYWMKNGRKIQTVNSEDRITVSEVSLPTPASGIPNYQVTNPDVNVNYSGLMSRLTIRNTHIPDEGIYTCVVENQAGRRVSSNAQLTIHTDGHWSPWSSWSNCPSDCGISQMQTVHHLSNHSKTLQPNDKPSCSPQCSQLFGQRTRWCNAPEPHGGGRKCNGESVEHLSCYDICLDNLTNSIHHYPHEDSSSNENKKEITPSEYGLLFGLVLAILSFLTAATSVLYIFAHKWCPIILKFLPTKSIKSTNHLHPPSVKWLKCKQNVTKCLTSNPSTLDVNSVNQFMEYKSEVVHSGANHCQPNLQSDCQQSLHYDCVSLVPMNTSEDSKSIIPVNHIYADHTMFPRVRSPSYREYYIDKRKSYHFNDTKFLQSTHHSNMNFLNEPDSQISYVHNQMNRMNTVKSPFYLTHSHSMQLINDLQNFQQSINQIAHTSCSPFSLFNHQSKMLITTRDTFHTSFIDQSYLPQGNVLTSTETDTNTVQPYFSVALSTNTIDDNHYLTPSNRQSITHTLLPTSSFSVCDTIRNSNDYMFLQPVTYDSVKHMFV